ncbi:NAD-dependent epimerase/dehydratase family protein [Tenacibaculum aquimarinum]|uniref:NAD-dependent epimerase/dehydratase family protein n=1 Tax=Tenacibaculum aquimarinum TaxID=2910675 RepID=UPI001F0ACF82|nr:NAD-dependent epimerase/dehydratase family protein [Tenacibaculum aquimarinum]MCH3883403.1 NAD-dependent epimerase/dehydratase family protein [Tenacibaculum aquimarinum]
MKKVLVTGISGYVGLHAAVELLKNGYAVKGSVRNLSKRDELTRAIRKEVEPNGNLEFCELNLLKDEGWAEAMQDCDYVLHIASPYVASEPKDENELIKPAIEGTQRALNFAKKAGVKRVVLTSSIVAMFGDANKSLNIEQDTWTNPNAKNMSAYVKSKTLAEKNAWDFIETQKGNNKLELVVINPGPIWGPTLSDKLSGESMNIVKDMITGKMPMLAKVRINMSDVRDIANIHVKALENEKANGQRFVVATENPYSFKEMAQILKSNGNAKVSTLEGPNFLLKFMSNFNSDLKGMKPFIGNTYDADVSKTKEVFNWKPISFEKSVLDTVQSVKQRLNK